MASCYRRETEILVLKKQHGCGELGIDHKKCIRKRRPLRTQTKVTEDTNDMTESNAYVKEETEIKCVLN